MQEKIPELGRMPEIPDIEALGVKKFPVQGGFRYDVFFESEEDATKAVEAYWNLREVGRLPIISRGIKSRMLKPLEHDITAGGRTSPRTPQPDDLRKYPNTKFVVNFNGNEGALSKEGESALHILGFI
jgi:hypothetical protein